MATAPCLSRDDQISALVPTVHRLAKYIRSTVHGAIDEADLIGAGYEAVVRAYDRYDASRGVSFESYAKGGVVQAMRNAVRSWLPGPEDPRETLRQAAAFTADFATANGRNPSRAEIDAHLPGYIKAHAKANLLAVMELDAPDEDGETIQIAGPTATEDAVLERESRVTLKNLLLQLGERQWSVIKQHYFLGIPLRAIADAMGVHPSRVSQIHRKALRRMRQSAQG